MRVNSKYCGEERAIRGGLRGGRIAPAAALLLVCLQSPEVRAESASGQTSAPETMEQEVEHLTAAVTQAQAQMEAYQRQLADLRQQLAALKQQMAAEKEISPPATQTEAAIPNTAAEASASVPRTLDEIRERQAIEESEIATHEITKVETESKYPLKVSGLLLLNGFVNTREVDVSAAPAYAIPGPGSTGLSLRQTVLGLDARGPRLFSATSHADLRVDFFASSTLSNYAAGGVLRLRTAHAALDWKNTEAFVELDRSILEPNEPSSLVAIAQPELAWAGNLWAWSPQIGLSHRLAFSDSSQIRVEAALIDTSDPQLPGTTNSTTPSLTETERSRWPGTEARIAFQHGDSGIGLEIGVGGYFSPHRTGSGDTFDAWAGTMDVKMPLSKYFEMTANAYRGQALAGLGGGGYVNYYETYDGADEYAHALDDVGGWMQLKARAGQRVEMNAGFGTDNPFAKEIQAAMSPSADSSYYGLARNRSVFSNVIYSPSAYLLFSLEYRRLWTNFSTGATNFSDVIGVGAGYRF
jgi:uncharacterized coiled-coil protein SlyX